MHYRRFVKTVGRRFEIDQDKVRSEARFDGIWFLQTDAELTPTDTAVKYKELWMVEGIFRTVKSVLKTRPVYHKCDEAICGHVFCSFLALVLIAELQHRLELSGQTLEWQDVIRDVNRLEEIDLQADGKRFRLRSATVGCCGKVFQATGVALPPTIHQCEGEAKEESAT